MSSKFCRHRGRTRTLSPQTELSSFMLRLYKVGIARYQSEWVWIIANRPSRKPNQTCLLRAFWAPPFYHFFLSGIGQDSSGRRVLTGLLVCCHIGRKGRVKIVFLDFLTDFWKKFRYIRLPSGQDMGAKEGQKAKEQLGSEASLGVSFSEPNSPIRASSASSVPCRDYAALTTDPCDLDPRVQQALPRLGQTITCVSDDWDPIVIHSEPKGAELAGFTLWWMHINKESTSVSGETDECIKMYNMVVIYGGE